jgi:hypothetical protein
MSTVKILSYAFLVVALGLAVYLVMSIRKPIVEQQRIAQTEARIIEKLKIIRQAQVAFYSVNGTYARNFNELINFVKTGNFPLVQRRETVIGTNDRGQELTEVKLDTLGTIPVRDSLFSPAKYPNLDIDRLGKVPGTDQDFEIFAGSLARPNNVFVEVFEVKDPDPVNPDRRARRKGKEPLRVGSRTDVTVSGNWE